MKNTILGASSNNRLPMESVLLRARELKAELDGYRPLDADTEQRIMQKFRLDWNYHSNNLEGNTLTYGETKALLLHGITAQGKPLKDHFEITGHNEAVNWIIEIIKGDRPLTENFLFQMHEILLKERYQVDAITQDGKPTKKWIEVGQYKSSENHVQTKTGEVFHFASMIETPSKMHDLIQWFRDKDGELDPIILAVEFHYKFIRIHPFDDGNGRMARLLMNFILMKHDYPPVIVKTEDKENYFVALRLADGGNVEPFISYITENLIHSLEIMISGANGEDISEPDDVLKELKMLERRIDGMAKLEVDKKRSQHTIRTVLSDMTSPTGLFSRLDDSVIEALKYFEEVQVMVGYQESGKKMMYSTHRSLTLAGGYLFEKLNSIGNLERIDVDLTFRGVQKLVSSGNVEFKLMRSIIFAASFYQYVYKQNQGNKLNKNYYEFYSSKDVEFIQRDFLEDIVDAIKHILDSYPKE